MASTSAGRFATHLPHGAAGSTGICSRDPQPLTSTSSAFPITTSPEVAGCPRP